MTVKSIASQINNLLNSVSERDKENKNVLVNIAGRNGVSPALLIKEFRETFLNIDMMIIGELEILFMGVYEL